MTTRAMRVARTRTDRDSGRVELVGKGASSGLGYFDGGKGRAGYAPSERCRRHRACALYRGHGGDCDPRSEPERARALTRLLDRGLRDEALTKAVEREGREALARAS